MKIKKGFVIQQVGGQWVAVATDSAAVEFSGIVKLNDTAALAWKGVEEGLSREQIVARVVESYDVDEQQAGNDADAFLQALVQSGIASE